MNYLKPAVENLADHLIICPADQRRAVVRAEFYPAIVATLTNRTESDFRIAHLICSKLCSMQVYHSISRPSPKLKNRYSDSIASAYAFTIFSLPANADTRTRRELLGR